jgi:hypothetical protein
MKHRKHKFWNIILKHRFQWNITNLNYRKIKHFKFYLSYWFPHQHHQEWKHLISKLCIFWLIASIHLDGLFCLLQCAFMYTIRQSFFQLSNTIIIYNGNGMNITIVEHDSIVFKHVSSCFERISKLWKINWIYKKKTYLVYICSKGSNDCDHTLKTTFLHHYGLPTIK